MGNILAPVAAMIGLTGTVWSLLYIRRLPFLQKNDIDPQSINTPTKKQVILTQFDSGEYAELPAYNLANLFQLPVLFYVVCLMAHQLQITSQNLVLLAWVYVALRTLHSFIHCTYNKVIHRFVAYFLSSLILWLMAIYVGLQLFST